MTTGNGLRKPGQERIILTGRLVTETGLHIGSGYGSERTDATVLRDAWGNPFIPGSSFKGALRSTVERMVASLGGAPITSCQLSDSPNAPCLTTNPTRRKAYSDLQESMTGETFDEEKLIEFLLGDQGLCDTCWLFGSPYSQSRLLVKDLSWLPGDRSEEQRQQAIRGEIRHGVGIDRDTLTARDQIKFDFEALPSQLEFQVELVLERPSPLDTALLALGLQEMILGFLPLGGIRSRGLGRCQLHLDRVQRIDLSDKTSLLAWLRREDAEETPEAQRSAAQQFITDALAVLETALAGEE